MIEFRAALGDTTTVANVVPVNDSYQLYIHDHDGVAITLDFGPRVGRQLHELTARFARPGPVASDEVYAEELRQGDEVFIDGAWATVTKVTDYVGCELVVEFEHTWDLSFDSTHLVKVRRPGCEGSFMPCESAPLGERGVLDAADGGL